jgi:hypothetical protein
LSAVSIEAPWKKAQAAMIKSVEGTGVPFAQQERDSW